MIPFNPVKMIRKIGKLLRGGAGRKEILMGTLCGVFIAFNPGASLILLLAWIITLLLNANFGFVMLGLSIGKPLSLLLAKASFSTGFFIIHKIGIEGLFRTLSNAPVTALMKLDVYAMVGGLPFALLIGIGLGTLFASMVMKARARMLKIGQHEKVSKTLGNKFSRFLLWLAFGKNKLKPEDEEPIKTPLFRKAGLITVSIVLAISLLVEFFLLDFTLKKGLEKSISAITGAQVDIEDAHLSIARGDLEINGLQIADPDKLTHNLVQIDSLNAQLSVKDLLAKRFTIDLLSGSTVKRDILRKSPASLITKKKKKKKKASDSKLGKALTDYFSKAETIEKYGEKVYEYLKERSEKEVTKAEKEKARLEAERIGYLKASADLMATHPAVLIHRIEILDVHIGNSYPAQALIGEEFCSNPRLNGKATALALAPYENGLIQQEKAIVNIGLRFDMPDTPHEVAVNLDHVDFGKQLETSDSFPINFEQGKVDISTDGTFTLTAMNLPFTLLVHGLQAHVDEGGTIMGMDSKTAGEVFESLEELSIEGSLIGPLYAPRVSIDTEKLTASIKNALIKAGKTQLANRATAAMDEYTEELHQKIDDEVSDLKSNVSQELKDKIGDEAGEILGDHLDGILDGAVEGTTSPVEKGINNLINGFL